MFAEGREVPPDLLGLAPLRSLLLELSSLAAIARDSLFECGPPLGQLGRAKETCLVTVEQPLELAVRIRDPLFHSLEVGLDEVRCTQLLVGRLAFEGCSQEGRRAQEVLDLAPHQPVQVGSIDLRRRTASWPLTANRVDVPRAVIVGVLSVRVGNHAESTHAAAHEASEKILVLALEVAPREGVVLLELFLDALELRFVQKRGDGNGDPLITRTENRAGVLCLAEERVGAIAFNPAPPIVVADPDVGFVVEDLPDRGRRPHRPSLAGMPARGVETLGRFAHRDGFVADPSEHSPDHRGLGLVDLPATGLVALPRHVAVPVGSLPAQYDALSRAVQLAASQSFGDLGPLVFGDDALDLDQELSFGIGRRRPVEEDDLAARALELFEKDGLVGIATRQSVRGMHVDSANELLADEIPEPVEARPIEVRPAVAIINQDVLVTDPAAVLGDTGAELSELAVDRSLFLLAVR